MMKRVTFWVAMVAGTLTGQPQARAWGERGHQIVTEVAVRIIMDRSGDNPAFSTPLLSRRGLLCHLANVPDIVWRSQGAEITEVNGPTHFVGLEDLVDPLDVTKIPFDFAAAKIAAKSHGDELVTQTGTAPWRVAQLASKLEQSLQRIRDAQTQAGPLSTKTLSPMVDEALLWAGLLAHFVGDLSQPDHVSTDFDGWRHGEGGLHAYIDSDIVDVQPLDLAARVYAQVTKTHPLSQMLTGLSEAERAQFADNPLRLAFALAVDAHHRRDEMLRLDKSLALMAPSQTEPHRTPAKRHPASASAAAYEPFVVERLAAASDALAGLWQWAWDKAGRPDLSAYHSYAYPVAPDFVPPDYLTP